MANGNKVYHSCVDCGRDYPHDGRFFCDHCDGFIDVDYDYRNVEIVESDNPLIRYFDLLPVENPENLVWGGCGNTPCVHAKELGRFLRADNLYLKDETKNPTLSTKDRMASVVLSYFKDVGIREFVTSSTGNSSTSMAVGAKKTNSRLHIFAGADFLTRMNFEADKNVNVYSLENATFVQAFDVARQFAIKNGYFSERGFFNPGRREGLKLAFLEAVDQMDVKPDWYFQAVSSSMGVYGAYKGAVQYKSLGRLEKIPKFCCVQQETCSPMVAAWEEKSPVILEHHIFHKPTGIARAILRGNPSRTYPYMQAIIKKHGGEFVKVSEEEILSAQKLIVELEGIPACPNSACTIAALIKLLNQGVIDKDEVILVNITGSDRKQPEFPPYPTDAIVYKEEEWRKLLNES